MAKILFFALIVKPFVFLMLGLNVRGRENLPLKGPAVLAGNHNSHLDTIVLMSLYPLKDIRRIRPVAAADYFYKNKWVGWFADHCIGIIPLDRSGKADRSQLFQGCHKALDNGDVLLLFPEGSRGVPEKMSSVKKGVFYLVKDRTDTKITPVVLHGLGSALPRNEALFVPFNCDVVIGEHFELRDEVSDSVKALTDVYTTLFTYCLTRQATQEGNRVE
ncbi:MAG: 1-acyl-sn-glycerol-3-phosphate acyltransferase [Methylococcales bacterium]|jgi:1-acyl-sn-glycerol-3-phosphate acyltransferase|nr:1-acyl-sn-glycerol-3-phosphate acyltransferase [Methylococcales bacterium]MBT7444556.1 1-acyl-sn-glycerol-3-phosphate acyltransferase [Methylococcales bacterium]